MVSKQACLKAAYYSLNDEAAFGHTWPDCSPLDLNSNCMTTSTVVSQAGILPGLPPFALAGVRLFCLLLCLSFFTGKTFAQQEPQFTKYMFNTLAYNPGYAGSREYMSIVAIHRDQWFGWGNGSESSGRPVSQTFSVHSPVSKSVGLGLNLTNDKVGAHKTTFVNASYAYRIGFGKGTLSVGLQAGAMSWSANWNELVFKDAQVTDNAFNNGNPSKILPDFGAGFFYYTDKFYVGASLPHLAQFNLRSISGAEAELIRKWARNYRHFYLTAGGAIPLEGETLVFKPSILIKTVGFFPEFFKRGDLVREIGAPTVFDIDASFLFSKKLWLGASFRSAFAAFIKKNGKSSSFGSADIWASFLFDKGFRLGFAYDYPLSEIAKYSNGSFELMIGYDFYQEVEKVNTPRYF